MKISLISVPYDQDIYEQGVGLAPRALLDAGIREKMMDVGADILDQVEVKIPDGLEDKTRSLELLGKDISHKIIEDRNKGALPVVLGGDCLNAIAITTGLQRAKDKANFGIAWVDAHGDFNTEKTTPSGFLPGMALAAICGLAIQNLGKEIGLQKPMNPEQVIMLGIRDLDPAEKDLLDSMPISYLNPVEVKAGRSAVAAGYHFHELGGVYLHIDIDAIDPIEAPGVDFPVAGGIYKKDLIAAIKEIQAVAPLLAISIASINPSLDTDGLTVQTTIEILVEILKD